ncbi:hypothetical protein ACGFYY_25410 [Streptomyces sp. NPDC048331]|uniref:hypothetical protein n=1 Tax=Streptomyces sp. NPDC048331 TaxID=3365534 RepID=UPI00371D5A17
MPVPGAQVDLQIAGTWVTQTDAVRVPDAIRHTRGRRSEGARVDPSTIDLTLEDPTGALNNRNPRSPYYGQLGRNTPIRYSVDGANVGLVLPSAVFARAQTSDAPVLDFTGDIDIRADVTPAYWQGQRGEGGWDLVGKWGTSPSNSWSLIVTEAGCLSLVWTEDGFTELTATSLPLGFEPWQRAAVRVTLDVNNGASGRTIVFYTSDTITGTWTQLGDPVVQAGATSINSGIAPLRVGDFIYGSTRGNARIINAIEVRSGIGGTVVANPVFSSRPSGSGLFTDGAGRTWDLYGDATITSRRQRAIGEIAEWAPRWHRSGRDVTAPVTAAGLMRRLSQGRRPLRSTLTRGIPVDATNLVAYWPLEDGQNSTQAYSPILGVQPLTVSGLRMAADSSMPAADALPTIAAGATLYGAVPTYASSSIWEIDFYYQVPSAPSGGGVILQWTTNGSPWTIWTLRFTASGYELTTETGDGALTLVTAVNLSANWGKGWFRFSVVAIQSGADIYVLTSGGSAILSNATIGRVTGFATAFGSSLAGVGIGHLALYRGLSPDYTGFSTAWTGETAGARALRLGAEEAIPVTVIGDPAQQQAMGYQRPDQFLALLAECEASDGGVLMEDRDRLGLTYQGRSSLYTRTPTLTVPYTDLTELGPPRDDDSRIRNDRTVNRTSGSFGRWSLDSGPMSTQDAPNGVGLYEDEVTLSLAADAQCEPIAQWLVHLGTVDAARYPQVTLLLHNTPQHIDAVTRLDVGSVIRVTNLPAHLPPGPLDLLVEGYTETLGPRTWSITFTCSPADPWQVGILDDATYGRADTSGSVLGVAASGSGTTLVVHTVHDDGDPRPLWTQDPAQHPYDLRLGGEVVTATAAAPLMADDFGRTVGAGGWGTASDGHTYTLTGGVSSSERSVASGRGVVTVSASQTLHRQQTVAETCIDADIRVQMAVSATATGGSLASCVLLRWSSSTDHYRARLEWTTGGSVFVSVTSGATIIGTNAATGLSYTPGATFEVRVRIIGFRILMRVWATGSAEPVGVWHIDRTDVSASFASGAVGMSAHGGSGNSNVGVEYRFDNFTVETPQRITVTRAVNGIVKAQPAGTDVRLATPMTTAL